MKPINKMISVYEKAMENEIYLDQNSISSEEFKQLVGFNFIRANSLINKVKKNIVVWRIILKSVILLWPLLNFIISVLYFCRSIILLKPNRNKTHKLEKVNLLFSNRLLQLRDNIDDRDDRIWITLNRSADILENQETLNIYSLLKYKDVFHSLYLSLKAPSIIGRVNKTRSNIVFSYTSFEWFLTYHALDRLNLTSIFFANHYDRWAVLFDSLKATEKILIQHGLLSANVAPPIKLENITRLYCYNKIEANIFFNRVLSTECPVIIIKSNLKLSHLTDDDRFSILFLGCLPITFEIEQECIMQLSNYNYNLIIKPHPVFPIDEYLLLKSKFKFNVIQDKNIFPNVDLVVSYKSTLAYEYEQKDVNVIYYEKGDDPSEIIKKIALKAGEHENY